MTEPLPDTWHNRELPILRTAAQHVAANPMAPGPAVRDIAAETGIDSNQVHGALNALEDAGLVKMTWLMGGGSSRVDTISGQARQIVGQWPSPESALDRILAALEAIAVNSSDEDTRTNARRTVDWLKTSATTVGLSVATAAITGQIPH